MGSSAETQVFWSLPQKLVIQSLIFYVVVFGNKRHYFIMMLYLENILFLRLWVSKQSSQRVEAIFPQPTFSSNQYA